MEGQQRTFEAFIYADDTLLKEDNADNLHPLLHVIEQASSLLGLRLIKNKYLQIFPPGLASLLCYVTASYELTQRGPIAPK